MHYPLEGIQVVTIAVNVPGPVAASRLRALGARVYKVEPPSGDPLELVSPPWYFELCLGQHVVRLNLKNETDRSEIATLLANSDLLLTSSRPESLDRLGLNWERLHNAYPSLCQVAIIGYPRPAENLAGHDLTYQAQVGLVQPPFMPRTLISDLAGAERAVSAALSLLLERERFGNSGYMEISLAEAAEGFAKPVQYGLTIPGSVFGGGEANYNLYETRDGWIAIAPLERHFWNRMTDALGLNPEGLTVADLGRIFATQTAAHWETWGEANDLPITVVREE